MTQITKTINAKTLCATFLSGAIPHWEAIIFSGSESLTAPKWLRNEEHAEAFVARWVALNS